MFSGDLGQARSCSGRGKKALVWVCLRDTLAGSRVGRSGRVISVLACRPQPGRSDLLPDHVDHRTGIYSKYSDKPQRSPLGCGLSRLVSGRTSLATK